MRFMIRKDRRQNIVREFSNRETEHFRRRTAGILAAVMLAIMVFAAAGVPAKAASTPFADVKAGWYQEPVAWAYQKGVTSGVSAMEFGPDVICTRGQIVTFLYRAAGSPEVNISSLPETFTDVSTSAYYAKPVAWAVQNNITSGIGDRLFGPDNYCTRSQIVTFLYRYAGAPSGYSGSSRFTDVAPGSYYAAAVNWALEQKITSGTSDSSFSPENSCTRAQAVTFLYRMFGENGSSGEPEKTENSSSGTSGEQNNTGKTDTQEKQENEQPGTGGTSGANETSGTGSTTKPDRSSGTGSTSAEQSLNVADYGAVPNDGEDDTDAINACIADLSSKGCDTVYIPSGTYRIESGHSAGKGGVHLASNMKLVMAEGTVLQGYTESGAADTHVLYARNVQNVSISGGQIVGDRNASHSGGDGEDGKGIYICSSSNITITDVTIRDCYGDGIYIGKVRGTDPGSGHITIKSVTISNSYRNNISITAGSTITIDQCTFLGANGHDPQLGIDIESNWDTVYCRNITISNSSFTGNVKGTIGVYRNGDNVSVNGCTLDGPVFIQFSSGVSIGNGTTMYGDTCTLDNYSTGYDVHRVG